MFVLFRSVVVGHGYTKAKDKINKIKCDEIFRGEALQSVFVRAYQAYYKY
jgi:hypothetical protein